VKIISSRRRKTKRTFVPTQGSLQKAQIIAGKLNISEDTDQLRQRANMLLTDMFDDIINILQLDKTLFRFEDYSLDRIDIFTRPMRSGIQHVYMDQLYPHWLLDLSLITGIWAFADVTNDELQELGALFERQLQLWSNTSIRDKTLDPIWPYYSQFPEIAALAAALMTAGIVFSLCHEIAHNMHDHLAAAQSQEQEFQADLTAYDYFLRVQSEADNIKTARVDHQALAAPCLSLAYIDLLERWTAKQAGQSEVPESEYYPKASNRKARLETAFNQHWTPEARNVYAVFSASLDEIAHGLGVENIH